MAPTADKQENIQEEYKRIKQTHGRVKLAGILVLMALMVGLGIFVGNKLLSHREPKLIEGEAIVLDQPDEVIKEEDHVVTIQSLKQVVSPASELISTKYFYTNADTYEDFKDIKGFKLPFTTNKIVFTYDGWIGLGFDINKIDFKIDEEKKNIITELPPIEVVTNEIDDSSFRYYDISKSVFNRLEMKNVTDLIAELKQREQEKVLANDQLVAQAEKNARDTIKGFLEATELTQGYDVIIR